MHTILLALRAGAFFAWLGCWCVWLSCRAKLPAALTPLAAMCGASLVIYAAALLNVIWPVQLALYLAGPVLAVGCVIREKWKALRPFVCISVVLFLAAAGAIAVVAVLVTMLLNLVGGPKLKVARAAEKTLKAYQTAAERAGLPDPAKLMELMESKAYSADFSVELNSLLSGGYYFYDLSTLEGIKLHAGMDFSMKDRSLVYAVDANYGSAELLSGTIALEDTILKLYSPQILKDQAFGLDTMTLGEDLAGLDSNSELDIENVSFNLFDFLERIYRKPEIDKKATQALIDAIEIEEAGEESMDINGKTMVCVRYDVLIPEDALRDYVDALEDATDNLELDSTILDFMRYIGVPEDEVGALGVGHADHQVGGELTQGDGTEDDIVDGAPLHHGGLVVEPGVGRRGAEHPHLAAHLARAVVGLQLLHSHDHLAHAVLVVHGDVEGPVLLLRPFQEGAEHPLSLGGLIAGGPVAQELHRHRLIGHVELGEHLFLLLGKHTETPPSESAARGGRCLYCNASGRKPQP